MRLRTIFLNIGAIALVAVGAYATVQAVLPKEAPERSSKVASITQPAKPQKITLTALGDSLTHGVGDTTKSGGWVPLIAKKLGEDGEFTVTTHNYGVTGDTAPQELKRLRNNKKLRADMKQARVITVTVGGNDLMKVLQNNFFNITMKDVDSGITRFQKDLKTLLNEIRGLNPDAPIYVYGIYNPFYVYFPEVTQMTTSVTNWNNQTKETLKTYKKVHYVDIDSVLTKGPKPSKTAQKQQKSENDDDNAYIFEGDHFHPNNAGYAKMTTQLLNALNATKKEWQK